MSGLENGDALAAIDTATNTVVGNIPIGQAPQAIAYVPNAVPEGDGAQNLQPLGVAGRPRICRLRPTTRPARPATSVALFDQGLIQVVQASVTGLEPKQPYVLGPGDRSERRRRNPAARRHS